MGKNSVLNGPGYSVRLPRGFTIMAGDPNSGRYSLLPPGSLASEIPAIVQIRPVPRSDLLPLMEKLRQFENPYVAAINAPNLALTNVTNVRPMRNFSLGLITAHIREFDAITFLGFPVRVMSVVMLSLAFSAVEVTIMIGLYRWAEFVGSCLEFVGGITLSGMKPSRTVVQAVVDTNNKDEVEYHLIQPDGTDSPITSMPAKVGNTVIVNIDRSIKVGNISGTGIVVGNHSISKVESD